jgi:flagellar motility protein MotE (MotC chaperone)
MTGMAQELFQKGDWTSKITGPVPFLKQFLSGALRRPSMKNLLVLGGTAIILFALSATGSYFVFRYKPHSAAESTEGHAGTKTQDGDKAAKAKPAPSETLGPREGPVARPTPAPGAEETAKLAASLRERLTAIQEMESQAAARQKSLELVALDIRGERVAIEELRKQMLEELKRLEDKLEQIEQRDTEQAEDRQPGSDRLRPMKKHVGEQKKEDLDNTSDLGLMFGNLTPEAAAKILEQLMMCNKTDRAAELLAELPEREAAKILSILADPNLAAQLVEKSKQLKRSHKSGKE